MNFSRQRKLLSERPYLFALWIGMLAYALYGAKTFFLVLGLLLQDPSQIPLFLPTRLAGTAG